MIVPEAVAEVTNAPKYDIQADDAPWFALFRMAERHILGLAAIMFVPLNWPLFWLFLTSYVLRMIGFEAFSSRI